MHVLVDMIDPRQRYEMMMLSVGRTLFGQLDLVGTFEMVDLADRPLLVQLGRLDCFVVEFIIGPAEGRTRWILAMTTDQISSAGY
jgi:hypothetical protein